MKLTSNETFLASSFRRLAALGLFGLLAVSACGDDEAVPVPQPDFGVSVITLDGAAPEEPLELRCDGTLAVAVAISTSIDNIPFTLSPANACGASRRCGYVRVEGLSADDEVLGQADSVTTVAVLELDAEQRPLLASIRVSLISGVDQTPLLLKDGSEVASVVTPSITLREDCAPPDGSGGAGGQGGEASLGGAGGQGGAPGAGGVGGATEPVSGAGGTPAEAGGAGGNGGAP